MSKKFLTGIDLNKNELQNAVVQNLGSAPGSPAEGQIWYDTTTDHLMFQSSAGAIDLTDALKLGGVAAANYALLASPTFTGNVIVPNQSAGDNSTKAANTAFVLAEINARLAAADAMTYKGAIDCSANPNYPAANAGDTYRVSVGGKIGGASGVNVDAGQLLMCHVDSSASGNQATVGANWDVIQVDQDGVVTVNATQTLTNKTLTAPVINVGSDADGDIYYRSGGVFTRLPVGSNGNILTLASGLPSWAAPASSALRYSVDVGDGSSTAIVITHNLGTKDVIVRVHNKSAPYEDLECDVERTSTTTVTLRFAVAPTSAQYRATVIG